MLRKHPAVTRAAVVGMPHGIDGEKVAAVVTLLPGTEDEIREFAKERVAAYEYPRVVRIVQALPMGPTAEIAQARALSPKAVSVGTWAR